MKNNWKLKMVAAAVIGLVSWSLLAEDKVIADFDIDKNTNNVGGGIDAFDGTPDDKLHTCKISFEKEIKRGDEGFSLKLDYSIGGKTHFNGVLIYLNGMDLTPYKKINFWIKGNKKAGFPKKFILELKTKTGDKVNIGRVPIRKISSAWLKVSVPISKFKLTDLKNGLLIAFVFDDKEVKRMKGSVYIDNVTLSK